jgi:T5SS/PEP-CTERM-associated repeat protein
MFNCRSAAHLAAAAGLAACIGTASAQSQSWNNAAGGAAATSSNWSPTGVPTSSSDLTFNLLGSYTVTFSSAVPAAHTHVYKKGTTTLSISSPHTVSTGLTVGDVSGDSATLTLTTGSLVSGATTLLGNASGSTGVVNVNDDDAALSTTGTADLLVGNNGAGTLNITGGGLVQVADRFISGSNSTSLAAVTVSGQLNLVPFTRSRLFADGLSQAHALGAGGDATMNIASGALADFAGNLNIAQGSASTSTVTVGGAGITAAATLAVEDDLRIGANASAGSAAGNGTLTVNAGGAVTVGGTLFLAGDPDGGTGSLNVNGGTASVTTRSLAMGTGGALNFAGGVVKVAGGNLSYGNTAGSLVLGGTVGSQFLMDNSATASLSPTVGTRALTVGGGAGANDGRLTLDHGSSMTIATGDVVIGDSSDDDGKLDLFNTSTLTFSQPTSVLMVGNGGVGILNVGSGTSAQVVGPRMFVANLAASSGEVAIAGANASVQVQEAVVGGNTSAAGGAGAIRVLQGGLLSVLGSGNSLHVWPTGTLVVGSGTINAAGTIDVEGPFTLSGASVSGVSIILGHSGSADGSIAGQVTNGTQIDHALTLTGDLTVGSTTTANGLINIGTIAVGDHTLTILDGNAALLNDCSTGPSGIVTAANGVVIAANNTLSGDGTIAAAVNNAGHITSSGSGLTFKGTVTGVGQGITGATTSYLQGGGFTGAGTIATPINADAQAVFIATGNLTMGNSASFAGVLFDGTLHCGTSTVTLLDSNGIGLGVLTDLNNGSLVCSQNLTINSGKTIAGKGTVQTPLLLLAGTLKPGDLPPVVDIGRLNVSGAFTMSATSSYACDIAPQSEFTEFDRVVATGPITLNGTLNVAFIGGYVPVARHTFDIAVGSSRSGTFSQVNVPPVGAFGPAHVEYFPTLARLVLCYSNCDGSDVAPTLNVADFSCFLQKYAAGDAYANCDGSTQAPVLNVADFSCFLQKYSAGCP